MSSEAKKEVTQVRNVHYHTNPDETKSYQIQNKLEELATTTGQILTILKEKDFKVVQVTQPGDCKQQ